MPAPALVRSSSVHEGNSDRSYRRQLRFLQELSTSAASFETKRESTHRSQGFQVRRLVKDAVLPKRGSKGAAGYDLCSVENTSIPPKGRLAVSTGLAIKIPSGTYGRVAPRSGLAFKHFIDVGAGVIDEDYRGEVKVILFNFNDTPFEITKGDRIAQLVLEKITTPEIEEVTELDDTERGANGFGSTGGFGQVAVVRAKEAIHCLRDRK